MGTAYKIKCRHCGARFDYSADAGYGMLQPCVGCGDSFCDSYVETQTAIRCPSCLQRLNNSQEEFRSQVETVMMWD